MRSESCSRYREEAVYVGVVVGKVVFVVSRKIVSCQQKNEEQVFGACAGSVVINSGRASMAMRRAEEERKRKKHKKRGDEEEKREEK